MTYNVFGGTLNLAQLNFLSVLTRVVERGCKKPRLLGFLQNKIKYSEVQIKVFFRFLEKKPKIQILDLLSQQKIVAFQSN